MLRCSTRHVPWQVCRVYAGCALRARASSCLSGAQRAHYHQHAPNTAAAAAAVTMRAPAAAAAAATRTSISCASIRSRLFHSVAASDGAAEPAAYSMQQALLWSARHASASPAALQQLQDSERWSAAVQFMEDVQQAVEDELGFDYEQRETRRMRWLLAEAYRGRGPQQYSAQLILLVAGPGSVQKEIVVLLLDEDGFPVERAQSPTAAVAALPDWPVRAYKNAVRVKDPELQQRGGPPGSGWVQIKTWLARMYTRTGGSASAAVQRRQLIAPVAAPSSLGSSSSSSSSSDAAGSGRNWQQQVLEVEAALLRLAVMTAESDDELITLHDAMQRLRQLPAESPDAAIEAWAKLSRSVAQLIEDVQAQVPY